MAAAGHAESRGRAVSSRLDRALELLERLVLAAERSADALERRSRPRPASDPLPEPSETDRAAARKYARKLGVVVRGSG